MTDEQRVQIINLREAGNGYKKIGQLLGLCPGGGERGNNREPAGVD